MDGSSTVLPSEWIGRLFSRFRAAYGNKVDTMYGATTDDPREKERRANELVATWAEELGRYEGEDLKRALEAMRHVYKEFPPTLYQFADLCRDARKARTQTAAKVTYVRYSEPPPELVAAIHELPRDPANRKRDPHDWARRILQREAAGEKLPVYALTSAREVLGVGRE